LKEIVKVKENNQNIPISALMTFKAFSPLKNDPTCSNKKKRSFFSPPKQIPNCSVAKFYE
jgi:hypothetical protein